MARLCDKLWNWGHLEGSHDDYTKSKNTMTPEQFAEEYRRSGDPELLRAFRAELERAVKK